MLADTHCHLDRLDLSSYGGDVNQVIVAAQKKDVKYILCPGIDLEHFSDILEIVNNNPDIYAAVGVHPTEEAVHQPSLSELLELGQLEKVVCIGETGLDFYHITDEVTREKQKNLFKLHIKAACELNKPLIIHSRGAEEDIIKILTTTKQAKTVGGVMHCFTGSQVMAEKMLELGFYLSFSGIVTFTNAVNLREIAKNAPLEKLLLETDAPYLAPVPHRGKTNEPAYLRYIAEFIAKLRGISYEKLAKQTTENFLRLIAEH